jgi:hypothetical protein
LAAFFAFHSSAQTFILDCATAGAAENAMAVQTAAAQRAASPDFMDDISFVDSFVDRFDGTDGPGT